ncbi:hypothetical protein [Trueperella pyogenes]|uniref:hypothetical protein n=2 Tax=Trueperella pyogenes TaxID=1661 RepID=UPI00043ABD6B|nr:hypothetical protein [Trueperella pyogenes]AHU90499.1 hypothetical protein CQ11_05690 [Trueperella pyogenes]AWG04012.1 hypothetical protein DC090_06015 [Trueperella pyogenes]AWG16742.1 hypothetical protein DDE06_07945 [Trueperella pyogenes]AZR05622.1 hypothetical protein EBQ11_10540 [Trueperella pyogenes]OQD37464.1 hypothetical protein B1R42_06125 [Trueperella pyogenes]
MRFALERLRSSKAGVAILAGAIALLLLMSFVIVYLSHDAPAQVVDFAARMKVSETNLVWSVLAVSMDWIGQVMFIVGILSAAFNRTYLGAGVTRKQLLIANYSHGLIMLGCVSVIVGSLWALAFAVGHPVVHGVSVASVALIFLGFALMYLAGHTVTALFLRFRPGLVIAGFALTIALGILILLMTTYDEANTVRVTVDFVRGISIEADDGTIRQVGNASALGNAYLTTALSYVITLALGAWATLTLPMRRS